MKKIRKLMTGIVCVSLFLSGCVTGQGASSGVNVGPQLSSLFNKAARMGKDQNDPLAPGRQKLDVVIPVFDPGLPDDGTEYDTEGVWPDLRRAESIRFAYKLKTALEDTNAFGAVRVVPDATATGDLYILGAIQESNGEDVEFEMQVFDIAGKRWLYESINHEVTSSFYKNIRNKEKDPYDPLFAKAAEALVEELSYHEAAELEDIKRITELRFGANFVEDAFVEYLPEENGVYELTSFPSDDDPMLMRTKAIRVRDQLYVDGLQDGYRAFSEKMKTSYRLWQEQSLAEIEARSAAQKKAAGEAVAGVALIGLAILAIAAGAKSDKIGASTAGTTAGIVSGVFGAGLISNSFQTSKETKIHKDALDELGQSIDADLAPQIIAFEEKSVELTGSAKEQFAQWREFLKEIYLQEQTPDVQL